MIIWHYLWQVIIYYYWLLGEGFVLVFSFDQPSSLDEIALLRDSVRAVHPNAFILVVGNKSDLPSNKCTVSSTDTLAFLALDALKNSPLLLL